MTTSAISLLEQLTDTVRIALGAVLDRESTIDLVVEAGEEAVYADEVCVRVERPTLGPVEYVVEVGEDATEVMRSVSMGQAATAVALEIAKINIELALADLGAKEEALAIAALDQWRAEDDMRVVTLAQQGEETEACPGCGAMPGEGLTEGCNHPEGCGFYRELEQSMGAAGDLAYDAARERRI